MSIGRVKVEDYPVAHPGRCALCGGQSAHDGRKYIDFGQQIPRYGAVYFCSICLEEVMDALGWTSPEQTRKLRDEHKYTVGDNDYLREENERLRIAISSIDLVTAVRATRFLPVGDVQGSSEFEESRDLKSFDTPERSEDDIDGPDESSDVGRPTHVLGIEIPDSTYLSI